MQNSHHTIDTETKQKTDLLCPFQSPTNYPFHNDYYSSCQFKKKMKVNKNNKNIFKKNERKYTDIKTEKAQEQDWDGSLAAKLK